MTLLGIDDAFFRDHFRRRPVVLRGAARPLIPEAPTAATLDELRARPGLQCSSDGRTVWFFQQLVDELPLIRRLTAEGRALFEWDAVTCDLVRTEGPASIGCHFDEDDNFSVQLVGAKRWRLSPPDTLPPDLWRRRMLKEPEVGDATLGPDVTELMVEAGDVLYIPQTWIHWGEATGDSTSVTLVVNSRTFHLDFAASLPDALRRLPGWARSLPVGPGSRAARARALGDLVRATFTPAAAARVHPHLHDRRAPPPLAADMDRVRAFVATAPAPPTAGFVLPADDVDTPRALRALLARRTLRRLLLAVAKRAASTRGATDRILYQQCVAALQVQDDAALERLGNEPELVGLAATAADGLPRHEDPLAAELARALVPELIAGGDETVAFALLPDVGGGFTVRRAGLRLVLDDPPEALVARVVAGELQVFVDGRFRRPDDAPGVRVAALPRLRGVGPHLAPGPTTWAARNIRDQEVTAADPAAFARFCAAMESGAAQLAAAWPAAWREVADGVRWLLPLSDRGRAPHNYSVHALRGMIASSPRDGHRCAQTLAHEAGHNRLSTILDLFELCADPARVVHSPVVAAPRPLSFVFHGCYAFAQDIALTERLLPGAPADARPSLQRYLDECRAKAGAALDVLTREAELTRVGATVVAEVAGVLGR